MVRQEIVVPTPQQDHLPRVSADALHLCGDAPARSDHGELPVLPLPVDGVRTAAVQ